MCLALRMFAGAGEETFSEAQGSLVSIESEKHICKYFEK